MRSAASHLRSFYDTRTRLHKTSFGVPEQPPYAGEAPVGVLMPDTGATTQPWQHSLESDTVRALMQAARGQGVCDARML